MGICCLTQAVRSFLPFEDHRARGTFEPSAAFSLTKHCKMRTSLALYALIMSHEDLFEPRLPILEPQSSHTWAAGKFRSLLGGVSSSSWMSAPWNCRGTPWSLVEKP